MTRVYLNIFLISQGIFLFWALAYSPVEAKGDTFRLIVWNQEFYANSSNEVKLAYMRHFENPSYKNVYALQEVSENQFSFFANKFKFFEHINEADPYNIEYNTCIATREAATLIEKVNLNTYGGCGGAGVNGNRGIVAARLAKNKTLIISVHMTTLENDLSDCVWAALTAKVLEHSGPIVVAGDFNDPDVGEGDPDYEAFLKITGLVDEGLNSGVDHIAHSPDIKLSNVTRVPPSAHSDHQLLYADVTVN